MKYCPNFSQVITGRKDNNKEMILTRTRCKQWSCEYCAEINRRVWMYRIIETVLKNNKLNWHFWTITLQPKDHTDMIGSLKKWRSVWNKLMGKLRYHLDKFMYIRLFEQHKSGVLHVHMLASATFDDVIEIDDEHTKSSTRKRFHSATFRDITRSYGLGDIHDIRPIITTEHENNGKARNVASYIAKYMSKDIQADIRELLHNADMGRIRIIQPSHGWVKTESDNDLYWQRGAVTQAEFTRLTGDGIKLTDVQLNHIVTWDDYEQNGIYPPELDET